MLKTYKLQPGNLGGGDVLLSGWGRGFEILEFAALKEEHC